MYPLKQTDRLFYLETPLGPDKLLVRSMTAAEAISEPFRVQMVLVSDDFNIQFDQIVKKNVTLSIKQSDEKTLRSFNGYISRFRQVPPPGRLATYEAELVPWLWFLTLSADCLIYYQNKTIPEIIEDTFQRYGLKDYELRLQLPHPPWDYCCQYRESGFDFVSRLMEVEGMYYFFRHEQGKHTLVITDSMVFHQPCSYQARFRYEHAFGPGFKRDEDTVFTWMPERRVRPGRYTHKEYNYEIPNDPLLKSTSATVSARLDARFDVYNYPGEYEYNQEAIDWGKLRIEEVERDHDVITGTGNCRSMMAGYRMELTGHERQDQNRSYLITAVRHTAQEGAFLPGADSSEPFYENEFTCVPDDIQYRPPRKTRPARMRGSQTAVVVGPKGEEIYTDPLGRVKVQFHWDRKGAFDERSSCWIRVMQPWAGNGYGQIWIPRIGQEVIVDFLEGDPDRPIITGCVYNAKNLPPYRLPDYQTVSGVKSRSSKGGDHSTYNEIRIEDKTGAELLVLHAQRDMEIEVKRDTREEVQRDRHLKVHRDQIEQAEGAWHNTVGGDHRESVGGSRSTKIGGDCQTQVGGNCHIEAGGEIHLKAGGRIVLEAASISFLLSGQSGGSSFVDVTAGGVRIQGPMVWINCGLPAPGPASAAAPQSPQLPAVPGPPPAPSLPPAFGAPPGGGGASRPAGASGSTSAGAAITPPGGVAGGPAPAPGAGQSFVRYVPPGSGGSTGGQGGP